MRRFLTFVAALLVFSALTATPTLRGEGQDLSLRANDGRTTLVITFNNGRQQTYSLAEIARIEFKGSDTTPGTDPVVGPWNWSAAGWTVTFLPGGRVEASSGRESNSGTWRVTGTNPRTYEIRWSSRERSIDTLSLSADGSRLAGRNQAGAPVSATRK